jgi:16S rRNA (uracil1498-N3)-methyltransferase
MDALVEKATELGAAALQPLICERSVVRLAGERAEARQRHWQAVAASASEQCGRVRVPRIAVPTRFDAWLGELGEAAPPGGRWLLSLAASARRPAALHDPTRGDSAPGLLVLSGPEGGLAPEEEAAALRRGFLPVSLGPRTLRADTAPLALLAWLGLADRRRHE